MSKLIKEIETILTTAMSKIEELRDSIADEIDNAGEGATEEQEGDLRAAEELESHVQSALDEIADSFPATENPSKVA